MYRYDLEITSDVKANKLKPKAIVKANPANIKTGYTTKNQFFLAEKNLPLRLSRTRLLLFFTLIFQDISREFTKNCEISTVKGKYPGSFAGINGKAARAIITTRTQDIRTSFRSLSRLFQKFINLFLMLLTLHVATIAYSHIFWNKIGKKRKKRKNQN